MAKNLVSKTTTPTLEKVLERIEAEISALETTRTKIENELSQRKNPNLNYNLVDFFVEI